MLRNSHGKYAVPLTPTTLEEDMAAFDRLPKDFREALNYASYKANAIETERRQAEFPRQVLKMVLDRVTAANAAAVYGPDHPQARKIQ